MLMSDQNPIQITPGKIDAVESSHDIAAAVKYATHILHIGESCFFGTKKQYLESSLGKAFTGQEEEEE